MVSQGNGTIEPSTRTLRGRLLGPLLATLVAVASCSDDPSAINLGTGSSSSSSGTSSGTGGTTSEAAYFRPHIQADLDVLKCSDASCHGGSGVPMKVVAHPSSDKSWLDNYSQVKARAGSTSSSLLIDKATGDQEHVGSLGSDDAVIKRWRGWIAAGTPYQLGTGAAGAGAGTPTGGAGGKPPGSLSWTTDIYPMLISNACLDCHGTTGIKGNYSLATYQAALGSGSDSVPNVIAGDANSKLVQYAAAAHTNISAADAQLIYSWVVDWSAQED